VIGVTFQHDRLSVTPEMRTLDRAIGGLLPRVRITELLRRLLTVNHVSVGLGAIHGFRQNSTAYWQKHGVATCSASLGGFAVGAAHFNSK